MDLFRQDPERILELLVFFGLGDRGDRRPHLPFKDHHIERDGGDVRTNRTLQTDNHIELIQPRQRDPQGGAKNDALSPDPGFSDAQYERLALLYVSASLQHGTWLIPGYHAAVDAGIPDGHDDPQNFDLARWGRKLDALLGELKAE